MAEKRTAAHVIITGKVQGVYFRAETRKAATARGVTGWVRNRPDGSVEAVFEGDEAKVDEMLTWCETGSPRAEVANVDVTWKEAEGFADFEVRH